MKSHYLASYLFISAFRGLSLEASLADYHAPLKGYIGFKDNQSSIPKSQRAIGKPSCADID